MPKEDEERTPAEDYLAQLEWQSKQNMRRPLSRGFPPEPNWKYKIIRAKDNESLPRSWPILIWLLIGAAIVVIGFALYRVLVENLLAFLFFGTALTIILIILILAIRDGSTKREDPGDMDE
jgi:hypothetical protein